MSSYLAAVMSEMVKRSYVLYRYRTTMYRRSEVHRAKLTYYC